MRNVILTAIFFILVLSVPYILDAGVVLDPKNQTPSSSWVDPNYNQAQGEYFISKNGLLCANKIWEVPVNGLIVPARKCQLPDGAWATFYY